MRGRSVRRSIRLSIRLSIRAALSLLLAALAAATGTAAAQQRQGGAAAGRDDLHVLPIRGNVSMIVGGGGYVTVSAGIDGIFMVDGGSAATAARILAAVSEIGSRAVGAPGRMTTCVGPACHEAGGLGPFLPFGWAGPSYNAVIASPRAPKPIRWIVETTLDVDHTGAVAALATAGTTYNGGEAGRLIGERTTATVVAHENILKRMTIEKRPEGAWPTETYYTPTYKMSQYINGEGIQVYHAPAAITDGDSFVYFRFSDVLAAGDLFTPGRYPAIQVGKGGSVQGVIAGLNAMIDIAFPEYRHQGGTMIVPGHGRLGDTADLAIYRNMIVVVRDRIQDLVKQGMTLAQVRAARPTMDFDGIYGAPDAFIEAVYRGVSGKQ